MGRLMTSRLLRHRYGSSAHPVTQRRDRYAPDTGRSKGDMQRSIHTVFKLI